MENDRLRLTRREICCRPHLNSTNDYMRLKPLWRVDETYVKIKKQWKYLYRAVDSQDHTIDFLLTARRDAEAAKRFLLRPIR